MPENWVLGKSDSGWMKSDVFFEYICNDFNKWLTDNNIKRPIILFVDGHRSHLNIFLSEFCDKNGIILYALPPNTTHILQPADVSVFRPLKHEWKKTVRQWQSEQDVNTAVTKINFCQVFEQTLNKVDMEPCITNGFRKCGFMEFDEYTLYSIASVAIYTNMLALKFNTRRRRRVWSKKWHERRNMGMGILHMLNDELLQEDSAAYKNFLRLTNHQFEKLLRLVEPHISRQDTVMRQCVSARSRLELTLRFLATGESYRSLMYSKENMIMAIEAVTKNGINKKAAAREFKVPRSTLVRRLALATPYSRKMGPATEIPEAEEKIIENWVLAMARKGFPVHRQNLILSPADVAVFKPLKSGWATEVRKWKYENFPKDVTRSTFGTILKSVFDKYASHKTIQNGFRKSGLFPFDKNNVDYSKCIPNRKIFQESVNSTTPSTPESWQSIADQFMELWQFPQCVGALDGRHITFRSPKSAGSFYHNYKGDHSLVLLAMADACCKFTYINIGVNGRISDGGVFRDCTLSKAIQNNSLNFPQSRPLPGSSNNVPYVIVADDAFPLSTRILKPYPQRGLSHDKKIFNYRLSRARRIIEHAFGILANRFRVLLNPICLSPNKVEKITLACVALHNYLCTNSGQFYTDFDEASIITLDTWKPQGTNRTSRSALSVRDEYKNYFCSPTGSVEWQDAAVLRHNC
ncbi:hypothetical protein PPYR_07758 [Photinus pyralis]|uniref:DDE Tnp4 domain-containing protein n=2 Tax=Photinus pyralis TaxID=7054 RepID=A0A5N4ARN9_PHOPY|nr:hypothetical protein PPYR_07758 [Photinus pyralis]